MGGYCSKYVHKGTAVVVTQTDTKDTYTVTYGQGRTAKLFHPGDPLTPGQRVPVWIDDDTGELNPPFIGTFPNGKERAYSTADGRFKLHGNPCKSIRAAEWTGRAIAIVLGSLVLWLLFKKKTTVLQTSLLTGCIFSCCWVGGQMWFRQIYNTWVYHETDDDPGNKSSRTSSM